MREWLHFADDMLAAIAGIENAIQDKSLKDYQTDWLLRHATQRGLEIVSEASRKLPESAKALRPDVPWRKISGIGNILRHEYFAISGTIIWDTLVYELPALKLALKEIVRKADC